jgi:hypothetical protein
MNNAGIRLAIVGLSCLRGLLRLAWHHAYLFQHAHEIVEKILFHDLALFVPVRDGTEINVEALARGLNHGSIRHHHRTFHGAGEISDRACPFTLRQHDLVWVVDEMLVGKHFEKCNCLLFVRVNAVRWRLIRPAHNAVLGVITAERHKILRVPRIIQTLHILQVLASIHNVTSNFLDCLLEGTSGKEHKQEICLRECQPQYTPGRSLGVKTSAVQATRLLWKASLHGNAGAYAVECL